MRKYILLGIPITLYGPGIFYSSISLILQVLLNITLVSTCMIFLLKRTRLHHVFDWIIGICFSVYFCVLYHNTIEVIFSGNVHITLENIKYIVHSVNLVPFKGIIDVIHNNPSPLFEIIGNAVMLTPLAFTMLYFKWAKSNKQAIVYSLLCSIGIEFVQFFQSIFALLFEIVRGRSSDIDDVILNTLGAFIGVGCYILWEKIETLLRRVRNNQNATIFFR